jgi:hypothetical protein
MLVHVAYRKLHRSYRLEVVVVIFGTWLSYLLPQTWCISYMENLISTFMDISNNIFWSQNGLKCFSLQDGRGVQPVGCGGGTLLYRKVRKTTG